MSGRPKPTYFNGCLICDAVSKANKQGKSLSETELMKAFKAQDAKNKSQYKGTNGIKLSKLAQQKLNEALSKGDKVAAIKIVLDANRCGLADAKSYVDGLL